MTRLPFLDRSKLQVSSGAAWGGKRNLRMAEGRFLVDDILEYLFSPRGKEDLGLIALAAGSLGLIWLIGRHG